MGAYIHSFVNIPCCPTRSHPQRHAFRLVCKLKCFKAASQLLQTMAFARWLRVTSELGVGNLS
eukprot:4905999-Amphidinium_carterae.1